MTRRTLLSGLAAPAFSPLAPAFAQQAGGRDTRIAAIELWRYQGSYETPGGNRQHQVQPIHIYDEHRPKPYQEPAPGAPRKVAASAIYLKIKTHGGLEGIYGPIDREGAIVVDQQMRNLLMGKDALAGEKLWDLMHRANRHSRASHYMIALSAVDNCLWDLRGRYFNAPVYRLLGGPTRPAVEAYGSCLGYSVELDAARARAQALLKQGYRHQKWFMAYGPGDGPGALKKCVDLVATLRESLGEEAEIMFDAFNGWHLDFAIAWAKQAERYRPRWIEEAFPMDKLDSFVQLRKATSIPVATGEHMYGRWEARRFLSEGAISVVQADPEWCGGVSELTKICHIASTYDAQVVPHGHSLHTALHVVAAQSPITCPLVEYLILKMDHYHHFEKHDPRPVNGLIALPDRPGFGIEIDPAKVEKQSPASWS